MHITDAAGHVTHLRDLHLIEETNASGVVVDHYSQGLNIDKPLAQIRSGSASYYEADGLGSVRRQRSQ